MPSKLHLLLVSLLLPSPAFRLQALRLRLLPLPRFRDKSRIWDFTAFVRTLALYLDVIYCGEKWGFSVCRNPFMWTANDRGLMTVKNEEKEEDQFDELARRGRPEEARGFREQYQRESSKQV